MRIIIYELKKLFSKKLFILCLAIFLLVNIIVLYYTQINSYQHQCVVKDKQWYELTLDKVNNMSADDALAWIESEKLTLEIAKTLNDIPDSEEEKFFRDLRIEYYKIENPIEYKRAEKINFNHIDFSGRITNIQHIESKINYIKEYDDYIQKMEQRATKQQQFSIFSKEGTFSYNNIEKTPKDFEKLKNINIQADNDLALETATTFPLTDLLVFGLLFLMCIYLFAYEREKNLLNLVRSTKQGRAPTIISKLAVLVFLTVVISMVYYSSTIITCGLYSGFGNLQRNVQSCEMFLNCNYDLNVTEYLLLWTLGKVMVLSAISIVLAFLFIAIKNTTITYISTGFIVLIEYLLFSTIDSNALLNHFKYINVFYMLAGNNIFGNYLNLNFFSIPVNYTVVLLISLILIFCVGIILCCILFTKEKQQSVVSIKIPVLEKVKAKVLKINGSVNLINGEAYKHYKGSLVSVALILLVLFAYDSYTTDIDIIYQTSSESAYSSYMETLQGELNKDKENFLRKEQQYFDGLRKEMAEIQNNKKRSFEEKEIRLTGIQTILDGKGVAFEEVMEQKNYILETGKRIGEKPQFLNKLIYSRLLQNGTREWKYFTILLIVMIFSSSNLFAYEHQKGMTNLIRCSCKGKLPLIMAKICVLLFTGLITYTLIYLPYLLNYINTFGNSTFNSPAIFLPDFQNINSGISIIQMILFEGCVHISVAFFASMLTVMLSQILKNKILTMLVSSVIFVFPCLICLNTEEVRLYETFISGIWRFFVPVLIAVTLISGIVCLIITSITFSKVSIRRKS